MNEHGFRNLVVWQKAKTLATDVYRLTRGKRIKNDFSLVDQLRRSAVSVPSNIAEGDERESDKDSIRFFHIAKGSRAELPTQLEIAQDVGCLTAAQVEPLVASCVELAGMLGALIRARTHPTPRTSSLEHQATRPAPRASNPAPPL